MSGPSAGAMHWPRSDQPAGPPFPDRGRHAICVLAWGPLGPRIGQRPAAPLGMNEASYLCDRLKKWPTVRARCVLGRVGRKSGARRCQAARPRVPALAAHSTCPELPRDLKINR